MFIYLACSLYRQSGRPPPYCLRLLSERTQQIIDLAVEISLTVIDDRIVAAAPHLIGRQLAVDPLHGFLAGDMVAGHDPAKHQRPLDGRIRCRKVWHSPTTHSHSAQSHAPQPDAQCCRRPACSHQRQAGNSPTLSSATPDPDTRRRPRVPATGVEGLRQYASAAWQQHRSHRPVCRVGQGGDRQNSSHCLCLR